MIPIKQQVLRAFTTLYYARQPSEYVEGDAKLKAVVGEVVDYQKLRDKLFDYIDGRWNANPLIIKDWNEVQALLTQLVE